MESGEQVGSIGLRATADERALAQRKCSRCGELALLGFSSHSLLRGERLQVSCPDRGAE